MAWRAPILRDLTAKLNAKELAAFNQHPDFKSMANPASDILEQTAEMVRGFCRSNRQIKMSPVAGTIPEGLISPAMDYAAFDVLKRIGALVPTAMGVTDPRKAAWDAARELFMKVASGEYIPESWSDKQEDDTSSNRAMPGFSNVNRWKILNSYI